MNAIKICLAFIAYAIVSNMDYEDTLLTKGHPSTIEQTAKESRSQIAVLTP